MSECKRTVLDRSGHSPEPELFAVSSLGFSVLCFVMARPFVDFGDLIGVVVRVFCVVIFRLFIGDVTCVGCNAVVPVVSDDIVRACCCPFI